ncbi:hypothetical protein [Phormidium sp. CCY1219]|uniref:hypothetical protein n=1 Tax=Phormidium sp. CCY1219 TaxID=2886104 RepID=UPI002D1F12FD|nr:hypothetical protein [Phormidium sp. CCY1219]MEB3830366.1 hypothetical protein [Phormidium sp. CCY1219]
MAILLHLGEDIVKRSLLARRPRKALHSPGVAVLLTGVMRRDRGLHSLRPGN